MSTDPNAAGAAADSTWAQAQEDAKNMIIRKTVENFESIASKMEQELFQSKNTVQAQESDLVTLRKEKAALAEELQRKQAAMLKLQTQYQTTISQQETLEGTAQAKLERADRLATETDALREEISRLNESNKGYQEKLADLETQSKLDGSEVLPLRYQVSRLTTEVDTVSSHSKWLESELNDKNDRLMELMTSSATEVANLRSTADMSTQEKEELRSETETLTQQLSAADAKQERLAEALRTTKQDAAENVLNLKNELQSTNRLSSLREEQLQRLQSKHDGLERQLVALKGLAQEAENESSDAISRNQSHLQTRTKKLLQNQANEYESQIKLLQEDIENANKRCKRAEDGLLLADSSDRRSTVAMHRQRLAITEGGASDGDEEPLNLTELYSRLAETEDSLNTETLRRKKAEIRCSRIQAEIEASAPLLIRQRNEYELALERQEEYRKRLDGALAESRAARRETSETQLQVGRLEKANTDLQVESKELAKQVQTLLVSRSTSQPGSENIEVPTSVAEMQASNIKLLTEHRRLQAVVTELETKLDEDKMGQKVEKYERELGVIREERKQQSVMVENIVQQRDMYRVLLSNRDGDVLGSSEEQSALQIVQQQSERTKTLEDEKKRIERDLASTRAELAKTGIDREAAAERVVRYEALNSELTGSVDRLQLLVSSSKADVARAQADASFHKDKMERLEETLLRAQGETSKLNAAKNNMMQINSELQTSLSSANARSNRLDGDLQQVNMKLRLAETQTETAKVAEQRMMEETKQLRHEISRQGALIDSLHRIESSLSAKTAVEEGSLKDQVASLTDQLSSSSSQHKAEIEEWTNKLSSQELKTKEEANQRETSVSLAIQAKKEVLAVTTKVSELTKKCTSLEAQLTVAKSKLGSAGLDGAEADEQVATQTKLSTLAEELESAKTQVATLNARCATFQKLSEDRESALLESSTTLKDITKSHGEELSGLTDQLQIAQTETVKRKEMIAELTTDLAKQRDERTELLNESNKRVTKLETEAEQHIEAKDAAEGRLATLESELLVLRTEVSTAQGNYERELDMHSQVRTSLRTAREEAETSNRFKAEAEERVSSLTAELSAQKVLQDKEKSLLENSLNEYEKNLQETRDQNTLLHSQLENLGNQVEKMQSQSSEQSGDATMESSSTDIAALQKNMSELREVVKFVRAERDIIQAQLDTAKRSTDRERVAATVVKRSLDEARVELRVLQDSSSGIVKGTSVDIEALKGQLAAAEGQAQLLGDSNAHLREGSDKLEKKVEVLQVELDATKKSNVPLEKRQKELEIETAGLLAEKESLLREIGDWKGRVQSLVTKFNQVDPEDHARIVREVDSLKKELATAEAGKSQAMGESKRIRGLAARASKELMQNKKLVENHTKMIEKLQSEKAELEETQKESATKKEVEDLSTKLKAIEEERENEKNVYLGANKMNDKLRERLRQFQKMLQDVRKKEADTATELKELKARVEIDAASGGTAPAPVATFPKAATFSGTAVSEPSEEKRDQALGDESKVEAPSRSLLETKPARSLPKVPTGGFSFAPSDERAIKSITASTKKTKATEPSISEQPPQKMARNSSPVPASRRLSGEKTELSAKEKLLERKRKALAAMKEAKELKMKEHQAKQALEGSVLPPGEKADGPLSKKMKVETNSAVPGLLASSSADAEDLTTEEAKAAPLESASDKKEGKLAVAAAKPVPVNDSTSMLKTTPVPASKALNPFAAPFSSAPSATPSGFGTTPTGFGTTSITSGFGQPQTKSTVSGFGQSTTSPATGFGQLQKPTVGFGEQGGGFGQPPTKPATETKKSADTQAPSTTKGAPTPTSFGQSTTTTSATFGSLGTAATSTGFGSFGSGLPASAATASGSAFGQSGLLGAGGLGSTSATGGFGASGKSATTSFAGAIPSSTNQSAKPPSSDGGTTTNGSSFLNIKPPGSASAAPPLFSFGNNTSITLPTPTITSAQPSPSSSTASGSNLFSAFATGTPTPFGGTAGGVVAKPLFGKSTSATSSTPPTMTTDATQQKQDESPKAHEDDGDNENVDDDQDESRVDI